MVIFGDYDVDGITSSALLWRVLRKLGADVETFPSPCAWKRATASARTASSAASSSTTPPSSSPSIAARRQRRKSRGCASRASTSSSSITTPCRPTCPSPTRWSTPSATPSSSSPTSPASPRLQGLSTACSSSWARTARRLDLRDYLDFVAVGTVADIVPLIDENRVLVRRGLRQLERSHWAGLRALIEVGQVTFPVTAQDVGFRLGPRLNASGRLGDAMRLAPPPAD